MKLLLDTHVWLWLHGGSARLGARARRTLEANSNELWLSPISVWEAIGLADKGRIQLVPDPPAWVRAALVAIPLREAALTHEIALASRRVHLRHDDPADRFLLATAQVLELTLVTADERLLESKQAAVLSAR